MGAASTRREFLRSVVPGALRTTAAAVVGGVVWGALVQESRAKPFALRPPGALAERDYQSACIRCGQCVDACPFDTLHLGRSGDAATPGHPRFVPRETPCYMCKDVPCARACPTGALERTVEIDASRMGLAVLIDQEHCLAFLGLRCEICYRVCPKLDRAIALRYRPQPRTGKHAFFEPVVNGEQCTGCGMCEHACPLEQAAIRVLPHALAQGRLGSNYRLGWREESRVSEDFGPDTARKGAEVKAWERSTLDNALDTLKDTEALYEGVSR